MGSRLYAQTEEEIGIVQKGSRVNEPAKVFKAESPCAYLAIINDGKDCQEARNEI
jgi:hypothetical protein